MGGGGQSHPGPSPICVLGLLGSPPLPTPPLLPMPGPLIPSPGHLLNRALFSTTGQGATRRGQPPGGCAVFIPRCQAVRQSTTQAPSSKSFSEASEGAGMQWGAGSVPTPDHCVCAKVSHSVGTRGRPWGGGRPSTARSPALQKRPGCLPPPQLPEPAHTPELLPHTGEMHSIWECYGLCAEVSPGESQHREEGEGSQVFSPGPWT